MVAYLHYLIKMFSAIFRINTLFEVALVSVFYSMDFVNELQQL